LNGDALFRIAPIVDGAVGGLHSHGLQTSAVNLPIRLSAIINTR
jgi:hypothetical protein